MVDTSPESWAEYYDLTEDRELHDRFRRVMELVDGEDGRSRVVVDLGCGSGVESRRFLERGWYVFATDAEAEAIARLEAVVDEEQRSRLTTAVGAFDEVELPEADLVFAHYSLPFAAAERFDASVGAALDAVRPGGWFYGQLFGPNDDWANDGTTPIDRDRIVELFAGFDPLRITEEEEDGEYTGGTKHWHVFTVEAQRPR